MLLIIDAKMHNCPAQWYLQSPKSVPRICTPAVNTDNQIFREGNLFQRSVKGSFAQGYAPGIKARIGIYD